MAIALRDLEHLLERARRRQPHAARVVAEVELGVDRPRRRGQAQRRLDDALARARDQPGAPLVRGRSAGPSRARGRAGRPRSSSSAAAGRTPCATSAPRAGSSRARGPQPAGGAHASSLVGGQARGRPPGARLVLGGRRRSAQARGTPRCGVRPSLTTASISRRSASRRRARSASCITRRAVLTPSATMFISAAISSIVCPWRASRPTVRLRLSGLMQVAIRSPIAGEPGERRARRPSPRRGASARPAPRRSPARACCRRCRGRRPSPPRSPRRS